MGDERKTREQLVAELSELREWLAEANRRIADLEAECERVEELLMREVANWRTHGILIPRVRLELINPYRERLRGLDKEAWECLLRSAMQSFPCGVLDGALSPRQWRRWACARGFSERSSQR